MKAIGYIRVSTEDQHLGPEAQLAGLEAWCARSGAELLAVYKDEGVSGAVDHDEREGFVSALAAVIEHRAGVFLVAKRDRLARDVSVAAMAEAAVRKAGARVVSVAGEGTETEDPNDPGGFLMRGIVDLFAAYERTLIRARTRAALAVKRHRGEALGGNAPFGYRIELPADPKLPKMLRPDDAEQPTLTLILQLHGTDGLSLRQIAARLNAEQVPCRGTQWHATTIDRILRRTPTG